MSDPPGTGIGINYGNVVTWAIVVLGMGITYGTLYGTLRGSVDSIGEINNRQDDFIKVSTELLTSLQMQNVQTAADLRQIRERMDGLQTQLTTSHAEKNEADSYFQGQIDNLRDTLAEHDRNVSDLRTLLSELRVRDDAARSYEERRPSPPPALHSR